MSKAMQHGKQGKRGNARSSLACDTTRKDGEVSNGTPNSIPTLTFLTGEALGRELPLIQQQITFGRGEDCDVVLTDRSVSRRHARLSCRKLAAKVDNISVVLQDLNSRNGTLVNYKKVRRTTLKPGDKICLGRVILKFEYRDLADQNFYDEIYRLATRDSLSGLLNKAAITRTLREEETKSSRYHRQFSTVLMDLDDFKSLNDTYGHLTGDHVLQCVADVMRENMRRQDSAGRFGGEEFLLILPETGLAGAASLSERIRITIEKSVSSRLGLVKPVTISAGVAASTHDGADCENLLERSDVALYRAKSLGKNRVELWESSTTQFAGSTGMSR